MGERVQGFELYDFEALFCELRNEFLRLKWKVFRGGIR